MKFERLLAPGVRLIDDQNLGTIIEIKHRGHRARISLFGGHILSWQPANNDPVLWLSQATALEQQAQSLNHHI